VRFPGDDADELSWLRALVAGGGRRGVVLREETDLRTAPD
jgi:hypothetical protein